MNKIKLLILYFLSILPCAIRVMMYRLLFKYRIGNNVKIGFGTVIYGNRVEIGGNSQIGKFNRILSDATVVGNYVEIGNNNLVVVNIFELRSRAKISSSVSIKGNILGKNSVFRMDMNSWIFDECIIDVSSEVLLGKNVGIGGRSFIFTHGYWLSVLDGFPIANGRVKFGDNVWVPWNCFINPGVEIGNNVVLGARALVNKDIPSGVLAAGIPAKTIKESAVSVDSEKRIELMINMIQEYFNDYHIIYEEIESEHLIEYVLKTKAYSIFLIKEKILSNLYLNTKDVYMINDIVDIEILRNNIVYSILDYKCSSYNKFPEELKIFFNFVRSWGLRIYPWDET